jgi:hypothetical protein
MEDALLPGMVLASLAWEFMSPPAFFDKGKIAMLEYLHVPRNLTISDHRVQRPEIAIRVYSRRSDSS